jgi:hypothetical protein
VIFPDADEFASAIPEGHRSREKAYHVKAHRGSKEGMLKSKFSDRGLEVNFAQDICSSLGLVLCSASRNH